MKILVVDDERLALADIIARVKEVKPHAEVVGFANSDDAFSYLENNCVDVALLDIEMGGFSGIEIAQKCNELCKNINIIFVTSHSKYALEALKLHVSGYLMKPVMIEDLKKELDNLRYPIINYNNKRVRVHTFGNFEVFINDKPLLFPRAKCKECLAYLIDRMGARVSNTELSAVLWEDRPYNRTVQNNTLKVISDLMKTLRVAGVEEIIIKTRKDMAIDITKIDCDYYNELNSPNERNYSGEYMSNYSWSEYTLGKLTNICSQKKE